MNSPNEYPLGMILGEVARNLEEHHGDLRVPLASRHVTYHEALSATTQCVANLPGRILLPITDPIQQRALQATALETKSILDDADSALLNRPIRTGKLSQEDCPKPLSPDHRSALKQNLLNENDHPSDEPHVAVRNTSRTDPNLAAIVANATVTAVDFEPTMPVCQMEDVRVLWDTGAQGSIITSDLLDKKFYDHLADPIHSPYKNHDGTRVRVSLLIDFSNALVPMDIIATVVEKGAVPNGHSGVLLGQKDAMDRFQYRSIPRAVLEAKGEVVDEGLRGHIIIEGAVGLDGVFKKF